MIIGIPANASGANWGAEDGFQTLLSYCEDVGVRHVAIAPPMKDGHPDANRFTKIKERLSDAGIISYGGGLFFAREGDFFDESVRASQGRQLLEIIECYGKAGVEPVTVFCGLVPGENADEQSTNWKLATDFLRMLVEGAEKGGVRLAIHTLHNSVFNRYATVEQMFKDIPSDRLGICYDVAIHTGLDDDVLGNLRALKDKMPLMHLRTIGDVTPMKTLEIRDGKLQDTTPRRKEVDFPAVMRTLLDIKYDGILSLEHQRGPVAYARAVGYLKGLIEAG